MSKSLRDWGDYVRGIKQLAAAILYKAFDDLADPKQTQYIYASFFDSDYAKKLFDLAGVAYNKNVINARISQRPPVDSELYDAGTYTFYYIPEWGGSFTICVDAGYITRIERGGKLYRLERNSVRYDDDCSYIADVALPKIKYGTYKIVEGV